MVTAEIPECSEDFKYKWKEPDNTNEEEINFATISREYLEDHKFMVIYAAIKGPDLIRK